MMLLDRIRGFIRAHDLAGPETRVVVALSGGSDSMALAHLMRELELRGELRFAGCAHLNHTLRSAADHDERFSATAAGGLGRPFVSERADVADIARREARSLEDAARSARYEFLERACAQLGGDVVALGHTRDDQAETFLLRLVRGAGPRGLGAMHPRNGRFIRPLLDCRRYELREYLAASQITYVDDESNRDVSIPRNRIRAELMPLLESRFNPRIVETLAAEAAIAREDWQWMEAAAEDATEANEDREPGTWRFDVAGLRAVHPALRRIVVWRAMREAGGGRPISFEHVTAALQLVDKKEVSAAREDGRGARGFSRASKSIDLPGQRVQRIGSQLVLTSRPLGAASSRAARAKLFCYPLSIPGEVQVAEAGVTVTAEAMAAGARPPTAASPDPQSVAIVRSDRCPGPLWVRNRRPGDLFRPAGMTGHKKLQDFFVDRKVLRQRRDAVPIVVDADDRIVWIAGYGIDEEFRATDAAQAVIILRLKVLGGPA